MNAHLLFRYLGTAAALFIAGCANLAWEKQGAGPEVTSRALRDCRQTAELNSFQLGVGPLTTTPNVIITPAGPTATFQSPAAVPYPDPVLVQDFTRESMQQKGFALVRRK